jgi:uncharacterized protein (DUF427 family)
MPMQPVENLRIEQTQKRVRGFIGGDVVFDTVHARLIWEVPYYPAYYIPAEDVHATLVHSEEDKASDRLGDAECFDVKTGDTLVHNAARRYPVSPTEELRDLIRFEWRALTEWLEEDEPIYTHPRDPYKRIDILTSSRHVEVKLKDVTVADSRQPRILFETTLPPRYYLPLTDVRMDLLRPSEKTSHCAYKGMANYWSVEIDGELHEDVVWIYRTPLPEAQKVTGLAAFFNERVDLYVDGRLQPRPQTPFGRSTSKS